MYQAGEEQAMTGERIDTPWYPYLQLLDALVAANKLSTQVASKVRDLWENDRAELSRKNGPVGLIADEQEVFPLERATELNVRSPRYLRWAFQNFFACMHQDWALLPTPKARPYSGADWYALILRGADGWPRMFPFIRYGGQQGESADERGLDAKDLIAGVCSETENRDKILLLSEIGATAEAAKLTAITLSITPNEAQGVVGRKCAEGAGRIDVGIEDNRLEIKMFGDLWQAMFCPDFKNPPSTDEVLKHVLTIPSSDECSLELLTEKGEIPACLRPGDDQDCDTILTKLWRLANLYYWHLSSRARARIAGSPAQLHIIWHLYPYFGAHQGVGGMCEAIARPWSGPSDILCSHLFSSERMTLMRTIATTLMSGFENQMLYEAGERAEDKEKQGFAHRISSSVETLPSRLRKLSSFIDSLDAGTDELESAKVDLRVAQRCGSLLVKFLRLNRPETFAVLSKSTEWLDYNQLLKLATDIATEEIIRRHSDPCRLGLPSMEYASSVANNLYSNVVNNTDYLMRNIFGMQFSGSPTGTCNRDWMEYLFACLVAQGIRHGAVSYAMDSYENQADRTIGDYFEATLRDHCFTLCNRAVEGFTPQKTNSWEILKKLNQVGVGEITWICFQKSTGLKTEYWSRLCVKHTIQ